MASIQAYRAYNNQTMLAVAQHIWSIVAPYQITHDQAASGTAPSRNITFLGTCGRSASPSLREYVGVAHDHPSLSRRRTVGREHFRGYLLFTPSPLAVAEHGREQR
jgi:hypothetical protein